MRENNIVYSLLMIVRFISSLFNKLIFVINILFDLVMFRKVMIVKVNTGIVIFVIIIASLFFNSTS